MTNRQLTHREQMSRCTKIPESSSFCFQSFRDLSALLFCTQIPEFCTPLFEPKFFRDFNAKADLSHVTASMPIRFLSAQALENSGILVQQMMSNNRIPGIECSPTATEGGPRGPVSVFHPWSPTWRLKLTMPALTLLDLASKLVPRIQARNAGCVRLLRSTHTLPMFP
jgi:hypothetical protein